MAIYLLKIEWDSQGCYLGYHIHLFTFFNIKHGMNALGVIKVYRSFIIVIINNRFYFLDLHKKKEQKLQRASIHTAFYHSSLKFHISVVHVL